MYGGLEPEVSNVVFVYGQHDPWNVIGRTTDLNDDAVAIVIPGRSKLSTVFVEPKIDFFFVTFQAQLKQMTCHRFVTSIQRHLLQQNTKFKNLLKDG